MVLAAERDLAMESYSVALRAWLVLPLRLWREQLLDVSPPDWDWPGQWVALVLAAALVHCAGELLGGGGGCPLGGVVH